MRTLATLVSLLIVAVAGLGPVAGAEPIDVPGPGGASPSPRPSAIAEPPASGHPDANPICAQAFETAADATGPLSPSPSPSASPSASPSVEQADDRDDLPSDRLDAAIRACASIEDWLAASQQYPGALAGTEPLALLLERCADPDAGLDAYAACRSLAEAMATPDPSPTREPQPTATPGPSDPSASASSSSSGKRGSRVGADGLVRLPRKLRARVAGASDIDYFKISGRSAGALIRQTQRRAQRHCGSHRALACVKLDWRVLTSRSGSGSACTIGDVSWSMRSQVHLPRWSSPKRVDPTLLRWWRKVLKQSARHEAQHIAIQRRQLARLRPLLLGKPCSSVGRVLKRIQRRSSKAQDAFDRRESAKPLPPLR